jgi:hypothetical protein
MTMTMREAYESWCQDNAPMSFHQTSYDLWQAAYRAGQEAMRESAARLSEVSYAASADEQRRLHLLAANIRALPLEDQP